jgi:8-oxo-dGTP pyrophosphatase MutT (NUDIX family)
MSLVFRKSVKILLINDNKELLLMYCKGSTITKDGTIYSHFWFPIGGGIEKNETLHEAIIRELYEETGLKKEQIEIGPIVWHGIFEFIYNGVLTNQDETFVVVKTKEKAVFLNKLDEWEKKFVDKIRWFSLKQILNCKQIIFPIVLPKYLPDILSENYPKTCLEIDLSKKPKN